MKAFIRLTILSLFCLFVFTTCVVDQFDTKLQIFNKSDEAVFVDLLKKEDSVVINQVKIDSRTGDTLWDYVR